MADQKPVSRRTVIKAGLAGAATTGLAGFPFISRAQSDVIRIGHLTPRTGFLGVLGEYAFGHDLLRVAKKFMAANGGDFAADKLVPTDVTDFSPLLLEIRNANPDLVISNLAGNQITAFLKQYAEFGLPFPTAGFGFDTAVAWAAGKGNFAGTWPLVWHHLIETPASKKFVADFTARYKRPPENQAWGDYNAMKIVAQAMAETKSTDSAK